MKHILVMLAITWFSFLGFILLLMYLAKRQPNYWRKDRRDRNDRNT